MIASDSKPSLIDIIDYLTTDLLIGQPPANSLANYGEFLLDYLVILPTSRQSNEGPKARPQVDKESNQQPRTKPSIQIKKGDQ